MHTLKNHEFEYVNKNQNENIYDFHFSRQGRTGEKRHIIKSCNINDEETLTLIEECLKECQEQLNKLDKEIKEESISKKHKFLRTLTQYLLEITAFATLVPLMLLTSPSFEMLVLILSVSSGTAFGTYKLVSRESFMQKSFKQQKLEESYNKQLVNIESLKNIKALDVTKTNSNIKEEPEMMIALKHLLLQLNALKPKSQEEYEAIRDFIFKYRDELLKEIDELESNRVGFSNDIKSRKIRVGYIASERLKAMKKNKIELLREANVASSSLTLIKDDLILKAKQDNPELVEIYDPSLMVSSLNEFIFNKNRNTIVNDPKYAEALSRLKQLECELEEASSKYRHYVGKSKLLENEVKTEHKNYTDLEKRIAILRKKTGKLTGFVKYYDQVYGIKK